MTLLVVLGLAGLYFAARHEPAFYRDALRIERAALRRGSERMLQRASAMQRATAKPGRWRAVLAAEEINGWLAVDMVENHPGTLPPELSEPRVEIDSEGISLGCRFRRNVLNGIVSLRVRPFLAEPNVLALRIEYVRFGLLPLPLEQVLDRVSQAARDMQWRLEWRRSGGAPVALLSWPDDDALSVRIESLELGEGQIQITGETRRRKR